jgi:hypothetical protein
MNLGKIHYTFKHHLKDMELLKNRRLEDSNLNLELFKTLNGLSLTTQKYNKNTNLSLKYFRFRLLNNLN